MARGSFSGVVAYMMGANDHPFNEFNIGTGQMDAKQGSGKPGAIPEAAARALAEAEARRKAREQKTAAMPAELGGRGGKEPVRYGDWEVKGIASDF